MDWGDWGGPAFAAGILAGALAYGRHLRRECDSLPTEPTADPEGFLRRRRLERRLPTLRWTAWTGALMLLGCLIPPRSQPTAFVLVWCGVALLTLRTLVSAAGELLSLSVGYAAERSRLDLAQGLTARAVERTAPPADDAAVPPS